MLEFLHVTDPHLVFPGESLRGLDPFDRLRACINDILEEHADAQFCVITGDIADRGENDAYVAFAELMQSLQMPVHILVGNHDDRDAFRRVLPEVPVDADGFVQSGFDCDGGRFLLLDTLESGDAAGSGYYCAARQAWLRRELDDAGDRPVYLFMHHPPFDVGIPGLDCIGIINREEFASILDGRTNVRHLFFGHAHRPIFGSWRGVPFSTLFATAHQVALDLRSAEGEPARLRYTHERPQYGVVIVDEDRVIVHTRDFLGPPMAPS